MTSHRILSWKLGSLKFKIITNFLLSIFRDILCGKLVCVFPSKDTYKGDAEAAVGSSAHDHVCVSTAPGSSVTPDGTDAAYVADGTTCGPQMVTHANFYMPNSVS